MLTKRVTVYEFIPYPRAQESIVHESKGALGCDEGNDDVVEDSDIYFPNGSDNYRKAHDERAIRPRLEKKKR